MKMLAIFKGVSDHFKTGSVYTLYIDKVGTNSIFVDTEVLEYASISAFLINWNIVYCF